MRGAARAWLASEASPSRLDDIVLAVGEACANAIEHGYAGGDEPGRIELELTVVDGTVIVGVRDFGSWRHVPHGDPDRGRGFQIMQTVADDVEVHSDARSTTVTMRFEGTARPS
jgi:anti-sigma regulatory factor (Ser/Thr protein kinase)